MENKSIGQIFKGTLLGTDGEGSAKRMCMMFICLFILLPSKITYLYCLYLSVISSAPTTTQLIIVRIYEGMTFWEHVSLWMFAGLATFEGVVALIKWIRGGNSEDKKEDQK